MKKIIDLKETIAKKKEQEAVPVKKEEFYAKIDDPKDLIPLLFDSDTTEVYELVSLISYTLAVRTAERFKEMMMGVDELSIRIILSTIEVMPSLEAVRLLRTLFLFDEMIYAADELWLLDLCANYNKDVYDYFTDFFLQSDEIDPYLIANWLSDPDECFIMKKQGGGHDKNYCHM
jgi:hypothetical protein